jgi:hypothetical protein
MRHLNRVGGGWWRDGAVGRGQERLARMSFLGYEKMQAGSPKVWGGVAVRVMGAGGGVRRVRGSVWE